MAGNKNNSTVNNLVYNIQNTFNIIPAARACSGFACEYALLWELSCKLTSMGKYDVTEIFKSNISINYLPTKTFTILFQFICKRADWAIVIVKGFIS